MTVPATAREALVVEAIGDVARLLREVETLAPAVEASCQALQQANDSLREELAGFETRMAAITENAKRQTVQYMAARADDAARRSIDQHRRAMADAARVAFGAELGPAMQRLQATLQPLLTRQRPRWEPWLTHAAAAAAGAAAAWGLALQLCPS